MTISKLNHLKSKAAEIPNMETAAIGPRLIHYAKFAPEGTSIVEMGSWLGCSTAFLLLGAEGKIVHSFDRFSALKSETEKASRFGVKIKVNQDTLPIVKENLKDFPENIVFHKGGIETAKWNRTKIGLYVDDANKSSEMWNHVLRNFIPFVPVGCKLILMDYWFFKLSKQEKHRVQYDFMQAHKDYFRFVETIGPYEAVFEVIKKHE
jgi:hypothetical protein